MEGIDNNNRQQQSSLPPAAVKKMEITGLSPQIQIAVNMLQKEADRWETAFNKEQTKREKLELQVIQLEKEIKEKEHSQALQGIEDKKPSGLERFMEAFSKTPGPIIDQIAPLIGALGNLIPKPKTLQGVEGQLDELTMDVVKWMQTKPPEFNQQLYIILDLISKQQPGEQMASLQKLYNSLTAKNNVINKSTVPNSTNMQIFG